VINTTTAKLAPITYVNQQEKRAEQQSKNLINEAFD
jgi:hypothetical protein